MPRKRQQQNTSLPNRWRKVHGAYYYQVPPGLEAMWDGKKTFRLGKTLPEAYRTWSTRLESNDNIKTIGQLLDRYALEVVPTKAPATQTLNQLYIGHLRSVFGQLPLEYIKPKHVYLYVDKRSIKKLNENGKTTGGRVIAHREIEVLSHAYTKAVEWGYIDRHPFKGEVRLQGQKPRTRYVEDWEVIECLVMDSVRKKGSVLAIQAYIRIKIITGMARSDLLRLTMADITDDGIHIQRHKTRETTGLRTTYEWNPELKAAVNLAIAVRPVISPFLFCNRKGEGYFDETTGECHGWESMWQRFMERLLAETKVTERFTEHDLRAKCASDAETLEHARQLLSHADLRTTNRFYRRKPESVKPLTSNILKR